MKKQVGGVWGDTYPDFRVSWGLAHPPSACAHLSKLRPDADDADADDADAKDTISSCVEWYLVIFDTIALTAYVLQGKN